VTEKCFKKCITSPGSSMGSSDQKCVAMCMDRSESSELCVSLFLIFKVVQERGIVLDLYIIF
jgi:import inner membrane translocase subunit TIM13